MTAWSPNPKIYEINTWVWLNTLSQQYQKHITLANVPDEAIQELASYHIDAIWLMGIWHRGEASRNSALNYIHEYQGALPDIHEGDVVGSAYSLHAYEVDPGLGGREALARFREQINAHNIKLMLDYVPNHVGLDHAWLAERPDYFVTGTFQLKQDDPGNFFETKTARGRSYIVAHGRDPYFPGWIDTAQLNAFSMGYREAAINTLKDIASQCDGVRCDMAMLMLTEVFMNTWGWRGVVPLQEEFWEYVIPKVRMVYPDFLFIAEVYWNMEYILQEQGFDYTYDKTMYDRTVNNEIEAISHHLIADISFLMRNIRFIENHDEPRAASTLGIERSRPTMVLLATLPGALLLHDGQFVGRRTKLPVQISRQPEEKQYPALKEFYLRLLAEAQHDIYKTGEWWFMPCLPACDGCEGHTNIVAHGWRAEGEARLIITNLSGQWSQVAVDMGYWREFLREHDWRAYDVLNDHSTEFSGDDLDELGKLNLDMAPYSAIIYQMTPLPKQEKRRQRHRKSKAKS
jgi:hypothetical protein